MGYLKLDDIGVYISERTKRIQKGDCKITPFANKILCFGNDYHQSYPGEGKGLIQLDGTCTTIKVNFENYLVNVERSLSLSLACKKIWVQ